MKKKNNLIYVLVHVEHSFLLVPFPELFFLRLDLSSSSCLYNLGVVKEARDTEFLFEKNRHSGCRHIRNKSEGNLIVNR